ncbi:MAG: glycosyltransferase family 39 protein [Anaerolineae bacterium]|nr:glycosyltransferase family 39 protein [Anaerolineae bacterium]MDQ7036938.1 glycosyltransferase family 39 protein [Anaerolineae bacterium]
MQKWYWQWRRIDAWLLAILLLAAALRMIQPGLYSTWIDELLITDSAMQLARNGHWTWIGNPTSFEPVPAHSPLTTYLTALPLIFSPNWMLARLWVGLLGVVAVLGMYLMLQRYGGRVAAIMGATLLAVMPLAVDWGRFVWNPNYAPPLIVFWLFTGLLGYHEGKSKAQIIHWLLLSAIIQTQTALVVVIPLSCFLLVYAFWNGKGQRRLLIRTTLIAFGLVALTLLPWLYGNIAVRQGKVNFVARQVFRDGDIDYQVVSLRQLVETFSQLTSSTNFYKNTLNLSANRAWWWQSDFLQYVFWMQSLVMAICVGWGLIVGLRRRDNFPLLWLSLASIWSLAFLLLGSGKILPTYYMMATTFASPAIFGLAFARLFSWKRYWGILFIIFILAQLCFSLARLSWYQRDPNVLSVGEVETMVAEWAQQGAIVMLDEATDEALYTQIEWTLYYNIFAEQFPMRVINNTHAFPIASEGSVLASIASDDTIATFFGEGDILYRPKRDFRAIFVNPDALPQPQFIPTGNSNFGNILAVSGIHSDAIETGTSSEVWILWRVLNVTGQQIQFSLRLQDSAGNGYGQVDGETLQADVWQIGDTVLTRLTLPVSDTLPDDSDIRFQVLVYTLPQISNISLIDNAGKPVGDILTLRPNSD